MDLTNSRILPSPSTSSSSSWDSFDNPPWGSIREGQQLSVDNELRGNTPDPLLQWYTGNDGPWIPKAIPDHSEEYSQKEELTRCRKHDLRHRKPFVCKVEGCTRVDGFSTTNDLDRHIKSKHPSAGPSGHTKRYRCHVQGCKSKEKSWPRLDNFRSHLKRVHSHHFQSEEEFERMIRRSEFLETETVDTLTPAIGNELKPEVTHSNNSKVETATSERLESFDEGEHLSRDFAKKGGLMKSYPVPKNSNVDFYGREEELKRISDYLDKPKSYEKLRTYTIYGRRGIVKTDIALEYAFSAPRESEATFPAIFGSPSKLETVGSAQRILKKLPQKIENFKRKAVRILLNGKETLARPDAGAAKDVMSLSLAQSLNIPIQISPSDKGVFSLGNGKVVESLGRAYVPCSLFGDTKSQESRWFHVLSKLIVPLVLSFEWIEKIGLYTTRKDLLVDCPCWFGNMPTLKWLGSPQGRIKFEADGETLVGCADTGSDLDFMSLSCARRRGFAIDRRQKSRSRVMMADGTICSTEGTVHMSSIKLADFDSFDMKFHVLDGLPSDVIFSEEFLEQIDAFNTCSEIMDTGDHYLYGLNTLINLGPIQAFFSRKWGSKKVETPKQQSGDAVEEKLYWKNKATRLFARVVEEDCGVPDDIGRSGEGLNEHDRGILDDTGTRKESVVGENSGVVDGDLENIAKMVNGKCVRCSTRDRGKANKRCALPGEQCHCLESIKEEKT